MAEVSQDRDGAPAVGSVKIAAGVTAGHPPALAIHRRASRRDLLLVEASQAPSISLRDVDLYTVLPKAKSEPVYVKSDWERELKTG